MKFWIVAIAGLCSGACTSNGRLTVSGLGALPDVTSIEVRALAGTSCDEYLAAADALAALPFSTLRARRGEDLQGRLPAQDHIVAVVAFDSMCNVIAYGCAAATAGQDVDVSVGATATSACSCTMEDGLCRSEIGADFDGGVDASTPDSGPDEGCIRQDTWLCPDPPSTGGDADGDRFPDEMECPALADGCCPDTDGDLYADFCDVDSDGDRARDDQECDPGRLDYCGEITNADVTFCRSGGPDNDLLINGDCGRCGLMCPGTQCGGAESRVPDRWDAMCGVTQLVITGSFGREEEEGFFLHLIPIPLDPDFTPSPLMLSRLAVDHGPDPQVTLLNTHVAAAIRDAHPAGFGQCSSGDGFEECVYAFAIRVDGRRSGAPTRCGISRDHILVMADTDENARLTGSRLNVSEVYPGWALYRRNDAGVFERVPPAVPLRDPITVVAEDEVCGPVEEYVF